MQNTIQKIPFLDLKSQYLSIKKEIDAAIQDVFNNTAFILGKYVEEFEKNFANFIGVKHAIAVNSGTAALHVSLLSLGIGKDDEVITVPNTFFATAEAISLTGAKPVFVDIDEKSYNIDSEKIEKAITNKTKAIIPVHLYGQPCDMDKLKEIAKKHNLYIIEDCCQAVAAEYKGKKVGSFGNLGCFSFYPSKNLGAYGEGGIITTNDDELAFKSKLFRSHGEYPKNYHSVVGYNYRLEGLQGAVLNVKLKYIEKWTKQRQENSEYLSKKLKNVITPKILPDRTHVFHLYVIRTKNREKLQKHLETKGISTGIHYLLPIYLQKAYSFLNIKEGHCPIAEKVMKEILSLPMYPELTKEQMNYIAESVNEFSSK